MSRTRSAADPSPRASILALLVGTAAVLAAQGLLGTWIALRLGAWGLAAPPRALVLGCYPLGLVGGCLLAPRLVHRVGHIRAFAAVAALSTAAAVAHLLLPWAPAWALLRAISGAAMAVLLTTIESWLNLSATGGQRARVLTVYMATWYLALGAGQLLLALPPMDEAPPFLVVALLFALGVVPVALTRAGAPDAPVPRYLGIRTLWRRTPSAGAGAVVGGVVMGALMSMGPAFALARLGSVAAVGCWMAAATFGGLVFQGIVGRVSNLMDRRIAIGATGVLLLPAALAALTWGASPALPAFAGAALVGGLGAVLYPLSVAHAADRFEADEILPGVSTLVLVSSTGAVFGPLVAGACMAVLGPAGLLYAIGGSGALLAVHALMRVGRRRAVLPAQREDYRPVPGTTAILPHLDPRVPDR